jgi:hypothetical protein
LCAVIGDAPNRSTFGSASEVQFRAMNKLLITAAAATLFAAAPAHATGGLICRTAGARPLQLALVISHTAVSAVVSARLTDNGREVPVALAQSWLEPNEVRVDLTDRNAMRHELRLRAKRNGAYYDGSVWRASKRRWIRCREG